MRAPILLNCVLGVFISAGCAAPAAEWQPSDDAKSDAAAPAAGRPAATTSPVAATQPATPDSREQQYLTNFVQLTSGFEKAGEGYFSADMKWIIFQATPKGETEYQMYVSKLRLDGAEPAIDPPVRISPASSRNTCGYFSPDGKTVIFGSTAGKENPEELSAGYQRQGGNYRWAFPDGMEIYAAKDWQKSVEESWSFYTPYSNNAVRVDLAKPANRLTDNTGYDAEGSYSPDGRHIVFTSRRSGDTDLWMMKTDGSDPVQLTTAKGYDGGPFFSPDGKRILYRSDRKGNDLLQIFVADLAFDGEGNITGSTNERQLTDDANVNWGPYFHPDNKHIIYATSVHGHHNYELYLMKDDGSEKTRITYCAGFDGLPVFSPDGKRLMWSAKRSSDGTTQLFLADFKLP